MAGANGHAPDDTATRLASARAALELRQTEARLRQMELVEARQAKLKENYESWSWLSGYSDLLDRMRGPDRDLLLPVSTANDRRYGDNWPFWRSWVEHSRLRAASRLLYQVSPLVQGAIGGLASYVVGDGMQAKPVAKRDGVPEALLECVSDFLGEFEERNDWLSRQRELFCDARVDGEVFLRSFGQEDGHTLVREVLPEQLLDSPNHLIEVGKYGIITDPDDLQDVRGYWVTYTGLTSDGQEIPASEMVHLAENVHRNVKRGMPDISYDVLDLYKTTARLLENLGQGAAIQSAIAFVRQHAQATPDMVADFVGGLADHQQQQPFTGLTRNVQRFEAGTVVDMDAGQQFVPSPSASNMGDFIQAVQAMLRAIAVKWNAPEWLVSADNSSVNFASSLTAESPFVKTCKAIQRRYSTLFRTVLRRALQYYCRKRRGLKAGGKFYDWMMLRQLVDIQVVAPTVETRDRVQESQLNQTYVTLGVKSRQTVASELSLDFEQEERNNEEYEKKHGEQGVPQKMRAGTGGGGPDDPHATVSGVGRPDPEEAQAADAAEEAAPPEAQPGGDDAGMSALLQQLGEAWTGKAPLARLADALAAAPDEHARALLERWPQATPTRTVARAVVRADRIERAAWRASRAGATDADRTRLSRLLEGRTTPVVPYRPAPPPDGPPPASAPPDAVAGRLDALEARMVEALGRKVRRRTFTRDGEGLIASVTDEEVVE